MLIVYSLDSNIQSIDVDSLLVREKVDSMKIASKMFNVQTESSYSLPSLEYSLQQIRISLERVKLADFTSSKKIHELSEQIDILEHIQSASSQEIFSGEATSKSSAPTEGFAHSLQSNKPIHEFKSLLGLASMQYKRKSY